MDFNIKPLGVSIEEFRNNPKLQIEAAAKLAEQFKSQFTEEDRRLAKEKGYSENALLAGAWLGGVGGVRKVLRGEGNPSDKHWSKEGKGTTVKDRMDKFNKMQEGGVLKCQTGDKFIIPEYGSEEDFDKFILATEKFEPKTYRDAKGHLTIGYGLRQTYDKDLNPTPVKLGQTITEEEARIQHERRKQLDMRQIKKRLPNFDLYPKGLQYAIRDMVFNSGETSTFNPNTKFMKALKGYDSSGDYSNWDLIRGIAKHIDWNLDTEGNLGIRAGMRRAMATEIYDWDDNKTINKYHTNPKDANYYINSPYWQFGQLNPKTKGNKIKSRQLGGVLKCQDGNKVKQSQAERTYNSLNPAVGFSWFQQMLELPFLWDSHFKNTVPPRKEKEMATPVEEAYFKHYLNLGRNKELVPDTQSRINWDKDNAGDSEYVGIPQPVARRVQAIADTLNTGKIYREYNKYQKTNPNLPSKGRIGEIYEFGKKLLTSNKGEQANESMSVKSIKRPNHIQSNATGLEIFGEGGFGIKWDKSSKVLKIYDTYDFPEKFIGEHKIPQRKRPLRIREDIKFDPKKGSYLLRDNMKNYYEDESKYYK